MTTAAGSVASGSPRPWAQARVASSQVAPCYASCACSVIAQG